MDRKRPGALLAIVIIGMLVGALGIVGGCMGTLGQLFEDDLNAMSTNIPGQTPEMIEHQRELQERVREIVAPYKPFLIGYSALNLLSSLALLIGAILLVRWSPPAPSVYVGAAIASLLIDVPGQIVQVLAQRQTTAVMAEQYAAGGLTDPSLGPGADRSMGALMEAGGWMGICFGGAWLLLKIGFYVWSIVYMRKPATRQLFPGQTPT